jgi:hypothetical protein
VSVAAIAVERFDRIDESASEKKSFVRGKAYP